MATLFGLQETDWVAGKKLICSAGFHNKVLCFNSNPQAVKKTRAMLNNDPELRPHNVMAKSASASSALKWVFGVLDEHDANKRLRTVDD